MVQHEPSSVQSKIVLGAGFQEGSLDKLRAIVVEHTSGELRIDFEIVDSIPLTGSGKHRFIISELTSREVVR